MFVNFLIRLHYYACANLILAAFMDFHYQIDVGIDSYPSDMRAYKFLSLTVGIVYLIFLLLSVCVVLGIVTST